MSTLERFLARWSRRKSEAAAPRDAVSATELQAKLDAVASDEAQDDAPESRVADEGAPPAATPASGEPAPPAFDPATLPSLDEITAETDIRPFLAPGVPADLAREALRRAWAADPAVRDFVGLADYAWDYHAAGSMPGFGPLETTAEDLKRMVARIMGDAEDPPVVHPQAERLQAELVQAEPAPEPPPVTVAAATTDEPKSLLGEMQDAIDGNRVAGADSQGAQSCDESPQSDDKSAAAQDQNRKTADLQPIVRRNHGGALPKS